MQYNFIFFKTFYYILLGCIYWQCSTSGKHLATNKYTSSNVTPSSNSQFWQLYANLMSFQQALYFFLWAFYHVHFISYTLLIQWYHRRFVSSLGGSRIPWVRERCLCSFVYLCVYILSWFTYLLFHLVWTGFGQFTPILQIYTCSRIMAINCYSLNL